MKRSVTTAMMVLAGMLGLGSLHEAQASMLTYGSPTVLYSNSVLVTSSADSATPVNVPGAGELFLTLTDLKFINPFESLQFSVNDGSNTLVGLTDASTATLDLTAPTTLYADVFANADGMGLYNLTATFLSSSPVPLPATIWLLSSALLLLVTRTRGSMRPRLNHSH